MPRHTALRRSSFLLLVASALLFTNRPAFAQFTIEEEPIRYGQRQVDDPLAQLQKKLDAGNAKLKYHYEFGYLPAILEALDVPVSSQVLVFAKTSFQRPHISPRTPRALYFNDDIYIGYVQNGDVLEFSAVDPQQGAVFYSLDQQKSEQPRFTRQTDRCLICYSSSRTEGIPGHVVRSVFPDRNGMPLFGAGTFTIDHRSPLKKRWGGWYVTGTSGKQTHMGNMTVKDRRFPEKFDPAAGSNVTKLDDFFDTKRYVSPHSDIVSLMVMEHQTRMHNMLTHANYQSRMAIHYEDIINKALDRPADHRSESTTRRFSHAGEKVLKCLLFSEETELVSPIVGTSAFTKEFATQGPADTQGRRLRDFDLKKRIFKYPCSYLIYSRTFNDLPKPVKAYVYKRLHEVLTGADETEEFAHLSATDRQAILEILRETRRDLPKTWRAEKP